MKCYNCEKYGHFASKCRKAGVKEDKAYCAQEEGEESVFLLTSHEEKDQEAWFLDTRARNHMTGKKYLFVSLNKTSKKKVFSLEMEGR